MAVSKDDVSELIQVNNENLMGSFKDLLKETVGQIKHANEDSVELQMKEIKKLKFYEPHNFKRKANEAQFKLNLTLGETIDNVKSAAEKSQLEKVKSDLEEVPISNIEEVNPTQAQNESSSHVTPYQDPDPPVPVDQENDTPSSIHSSVTEGTDTDSGTPPRHSCQARHPLAWLDDYDLC
ncbi:hypothetical protein OS493_024032 [Desmophyllum pertusum]|uniref:Uncharacterized protein n=1 Tax=Desmophyllum pertusum TaxID=174260 RepID=A0A9W9ZMC9_9CNID|nr:hypothetical protein OS493_024032 [Desmophyllum pertusum]